MRKDITYINNQIFTNWLTEQFIPRKAAGANLIILDSHASHKNHPNMLQVASDKDIIILWLLSHTTHYLPSLNCVVFKPFKTFFTYACGETDNLP